MNTPHSVSEIARRLPERTTREVQDVIDVLLELWQTELLKPDLEVRIALRKKKAHRKWAYARAWRCLLNGSVAKSGTVG